MKRLFVDTGYLVALELTSDQHHEAAQMHWGRLRVERPALTTTSAVLTETTTLLNARGHYETAVRVGERLLRSPEIELLHVDEALMDAGWHYFARHSDKRYSLTDYISFVVMERGGLREVLTFDHHFEQAGFVPLP